MIFEREKTLENFVFMSPFVLFIFVLVLIFYGFLIAVVYTIIWVVSMELLFKFFEWWGEFVRKRFEKKNGE